MAKISFPSSFRPNAHFAFYVCVAITAACVIWQPLLLGFYYDDWELWVNGSTKGAPFSLARLVFMNGTNPVRIGCLPGRFLGSSMFGAHPLLWQSALLLVGVAIALSIVTANRALTQASSVWSKTLTAAVGFCWLLVPWNAGTRFWTALLPNDLMIAAQGLLLALLILGWQKGKTLLLPATALYLWMCVSYEVFYLQWIIFILLGLVLWLGKRTELRPVLVSGIGLFVAQGIAGLWNLYTLHAGYSTAMSVLPNWRELLQRNLINLPTAILDSVSEISVEFVVCAGLVLVPCLVVYVRSLARASERRSACINLLLVGICILGGLVSIAVYSLAGRAVRGTGVDSRSVGVFNFWLLITGALVITFTIERLRRPQRILFGYALAAFGLCLAVGQVLRASDWASAWEQQKKVLAEAPIINLKETERDARIVLVNPPWVNGAPVFAAAWDINNAIAWAYPFLRGRLFIIYNPWEGLMKWDGKKLGYVGAPPLETDMPVYVWRPADRSFWRATSPFVIDQKFVIEGAN